MIEISVSVFRDMPVSSVHCPCSILCALSVSVPAFTVRLQSVPVSVSEFRSVSVRERGIWARSGPPHRGTVGRAMGWSDPSQSRENI